MNDSFLVAAFVGLAIVALAPRKNVRTGRIVYWLGTVVACTSVFFMAYPPDWKSGIAMSAFVGCAITLVAYMNTPFLRVRGRTYAFHSQYQNRDASHDGSVSPRAKAIANRAAEPYGGSVSVKKSWWRAAFAIGILAVGAYSYFAGDTNAWLTAVSVAAILLTAIVFGYRDAILGHPIASRQHVQFGLIAAMTLGAFAAFYLATYYASKRWLLQRQAYGRHQRRTL